MTDGASFTSLGGETGRNILPVIADAVRHFSSPAFDYGWAAGVSIHPGVPIRPDVRSFSLEVLFNNSSGLDFTGLPCPAVSLHPVSGSIRVTFERCKKVLDLDVPCGGVVCSTRRHADGSTSSSRHQGDLFDELNAALAWAAGRKVR